MCPPTPCSYGLLVVNVCGNVTRDDARARHSRGGKINEDEKDGVVLAIRGERAFDPVQGSGVVWWKDESSRRYLRREIRDWSDHDPTFSSLLGNLVVHPSKQFRPSLQS